MTTLIAIPNLVARAKTLVANFNGAEAALRRDYDFLFRSAWEIGEVLAQLKEEVGHGNWQIWLPSHFPELGPTDKMRLRNDQRCRAFHKDNPNARNSSHLNSPAGADFDPDSVRKFMWGYIPAKERPLLEGDETVTRQPHYLSFVNHFSKYDRQLKLGRIAAPLVPQFRREIEGTVRRLIEIAGRDWFLELLKT